MSPMMRLRGKDCANTISNVTMQRTAGSTAENAIETRSIIDRQCAYCASGTIVPVSQTGVTPQPYLKYQHHCMSDYLLIYLSNCLIIGL